MHIHTRVKLDEHALAQVIEATQDGPWNNLDTSPLAQARKERAATVRFYQVARLAEELVEVYDMRASDWVALDPYADVSPMWQNVHYMLCEHFFVETGTALAVVRELAHQS